ncbi:hypothetical protein [Lactiplantibacillus daowaiensis]|uniref:Extracellular protein n=1 Tax=Lactiplantibacillus daowaiensis TaxID=2559918 RepID=A0ABW1S2W6_9LACO|nr:hypothetical protein [Lactiplantibacillus daowaiensis]
MRLSRGMMLSAGVGLLALSLPMAAGAKTQTLPASFQGNWYGYVSATTEGKTTTHSIAKVHLTGNKLNYGIYTSTKANLKSRTWIASFKVPAQLTKKVNSKTKRVTYRLGSKLADANFATLSLTKLKVGTKKVTALREKIDGVGSVYLFRQPTKSHRWDNTLDLENLLADY